MMIHELVRLAEAQLPHFYRGTLFDNLIQNYASTSAKRRFNDNPLCKVSYHLHEPRPSVLRIAS